MKVSNIISAVVVTSLTCGTAFAESKANLDERLAAATTVIQEIMNTPDGGIPRDIVSHATCVGVIPSVKKGAFLVGASYGQGVVTCKSDKGWSAPVFIRLAGASYGFQIGGKETDVILVAVNDKGFQDLLKSKIKLGADASVAAGPVGRTASAATNLTLSAELLSYSRSKGVFAGLDLNGADVSQNTDDTNTFYGGQSQSFSDILHGGVPVPSAASKFVDAVKHYFRSSND